jgi:tetratricopeptide (TPR) repeat protein
MKLTIKYLNLSVLIVFNLAAFQNLPAQNFDETIAFADYQFKSGNSSTALKTYQRALFFSEGRDNLYLFRQIAEISYINNDYESAQKYFGLAYNQSDNDSLKTELLFSKAFCQILNKNFQLAIIDLFSVNDTSWIIQKRLNFYLATCYFGLEEFNQAKTYFKSCVSMNDSAELTELFTRRSLLSPSPKKARIMSMILPGLGQSYSGDFKSGINSLLLTSGLIAMGINIGIRYSPIDAIVAILPWYQRYYTGGYGKAEEIAARKRQLNRNEVYNKILRLIAENSTPY